MKSLLAVAAFTAAMVWFQTDIEPEIDGATILKHGTLCAIEPSGPCEAVTLPFSRAHPTETAQATLTLRFDESAASSGISALYLPVVSDRIAIRINDINFTETFKSSSPPSPHWNRPFFVVVPKEAINPGMNEIEITLRTDEGMPLKMFSALIGQAEPLRIHSQFVQVFRVGMSRIAFGLSLTTALSLLGLWAFCRKDHIFFWLGASALNATIYTLDWTRLDEVYEIPISNVAIHIALVLQVYFVIKYLKAAYQLDLGEHSVLYGLWTAIAVLLLLSFDSPMVIVGVAIVTCSIAIMTLGALLRYGTYDGILLWAVLVLTISTVVASGYARYVDPKSLPYSVDQFAPLLMTFAMLIVLLSLLTTALRKSEALANNLTTQVKETTAELAVTSGRMKNMLQKQSVTDERERIMLDLHDGVGGQLVNSLAYMESQENADPVLRLALQDTLRDLSLMVDSLTPDASITVLLGTLRDRLEPLLREHGLVFDWRIEDEPMMPFPGPSQNLRLMRIVQEAITNVIKHADAKTITVMTHTNAVTIRDDGHGFDVENADQYGGVGLPGMKRRARSFGAELVVLSSNRGSEIRLEWIPALTIKVPLIS